MTQVDATAALETSEKIEKPTGLRQAMPRLDDFASSELLPASRDGSAFAKAVKEEPDFFKGEMHFGGEAGEERAVDGIGGIATLP